VKRTGTAPTQLLTDLVNPLITHVDGARALGIQQLAASLSVSLDTIELPISRDTGLILPGSTLQTPDGKGYCRSLKVASSMSQDRKLTVRQTIEMERPLGL